jgi:hypothetical protein
METYINKSTDRYMLKMRPPKRPVQGGVAEGPGEKKKAGALLGLNFIT